MDPPGRPSALGAKAGALGAAAPAATKIMLAPPAQATSMRPQDARGAQIPPAADDDDDDMPPLIYNTSQSPGPSQTPPPRPASASSPVAQNIAPMGQSSASSLAEEAGNGHGGQAGSARGHGHGAPPRAGPSPGLCASALAIFGIGEGGMSQGHGHAHGDDGGTGHGHGDEEGGGETKDWDGRYKYEVAQTLAARMKGAQVKPELADLHMSVDAWTAVQSGSVEHLDVALSASLSFDIDSFDKKGFTLLHYASKRPHLGLIRLLVSRGANINRAANSEVRERPLQCAIEGGDLAVVDFLVLQGADMHAGNIKNHTALHIAVMMNRMMIVELLIRRGANIDAPDSDGTTPLHWAAYNGVARSCEVLLTYGANFLQKDNKGLIPLHWAAARGHAYAIDKLTDNIRNHPSLTEDDAHKAVWARDLAGNTPLAYAKKNGDSKAIQFMTYLAEDEYSSRPTSKRYRFAAFSSGCFVALVAGCAAFAYLPGWAFLILLLISQFVIKVPQWALKFHTDGHPLFPGIWVATIFLGHVIILTRIVWDIVNAPYGTFALALELFLSGIYTRNFLRLIWMRDPGFVPRTAADILDIFEAIQSPDPTLPRQYCTTCLSKRPPRAKHCSDCNRCVARFDHQCMWTGKCVGQKNHRSFFVFVHFLYLDCAVFLWMVYKYCSIVSGEEGVWNIVKYAWEKESFVFGYMVWVILNNMWIFSLGFWQAVLISQNLTTNEKYNWKRYRYLQDENGRYRNPYDKGLMHNWKEWLKGQIPHIEIRPHQQQV